MTLPLRAFPFAGSGGGPQSPHDYIHIRDEKTAGTAGGSFTSGAWQTRELNTIVENENSHASLATNTITLAAGTYLVYIRCPAFKVQGHRAKLVDVTDSPTTVDLLYGDSSIYCQSSTINPQVTEVIGKIVLAAQKDVEVWHRGELTRNTDGFGRATNIDSIVEIYTQVELLKVA